LSGISLRMGIGSCSPEWLAEAGCKAGGYGLSSEGGIPLPLHCTRLTVARGRSRKRFRGRERYSECAFASSVLPRRRF